MFLNEESPGSGITGPDTWVLRHLSQPYALPYKKLSTRKKSQNQKNQNKKKSTYQQAQNLTTG